MLTVLLLYAGIGALIAIAGLGLTGFRLRIDRVAERIGVGKTYARLVWLSGTLLFWPIGLYVLATVRLALVDAEAMGAVTHPLRTPTASLAASLHAPWRLTGDHR